MKKHVLSYYSDNRKSSIVSNNKSEITETIKAFYTHEMLNNTHLEGSTFITETMESSDDDSIVSGKGIGGEDIFFDFA